MNRLPQGTQPLLGSMTLELRSDPQFLCVIRAMVRSHCRLAQFDEQRTEQVALAVDESCANVIRHCYGGATTEPLAVGIELVADGTGHGLSLVIRVRDHGPKAPAGCYEPAGDHDPEQPGGLGLRLMRAIMDSVEVDHSVEDGNLLILRVSATSKTGSAKLQAGTP